jgi:hypothetical protein
VRNRGGGQPAEDGIWKIQRFTLRARTLMLTALRSK